MRLGVSTSWLLFCLCLSPERLYSVEPPTACIFEGRSSFVYSIRQSIAGTSLYQCPNELAGSCASRVDSADNKPWYMFR